jgi:ATPase subunit of ABC transporter with duplicated ATPase domains
MESVLTGRDMTLVLVTHDRAFLEALATGLLELDAGTTHQYAFGGAGCYDRYRQVRGESSTGSDRFLSPR